MSNLWGRLIAAITRRSLSAKPPCPPTSSADGDIEMDPLEHATGIEKREMLAFAAGKDPYYMNIVKRGAGTKESPTLIPSACERRLVGCFCQENRCPQYMWLDKGVPKRCECGHWYKLKEVDPL